MADGVKTIPGTGTDPTVDTDEVTRGGSTVHEQVVKLAHGADGAVDGLVSSASPLPVKIGDGSNSATIRDLATNDALNVAIVDAAGNQITSFGGGTEFAEDSAHSSGALGSLLLTVRNDALAVFTSADGDYSPLNVSAEGLLRVLTRGSVAHDDPLGASSGSPNIGGGRASAAAPADVSADGDAVRAWYLRNGAAATVLTAAGALIGGDAANGLDVDVTRVSGTVTVDSELPAAETPADNLTNATAAPRVNGLNYVFDGTTWDRAPGNSADGMLVNLGANNDVTVTGSVSITGTPTVDTELPAAAALADNTANPTVPGVGAFLMVFDGTNWDRAPGTTADGTLVNLGANNDVTVTGTVTVDSELPAAAALADNTANPTAPAVGAFGMLWDGATWDRAPGNILGGAFVQGPHATDVAITQNPQQNGGRASIAVPGAVSTDGDAQHNWLDLSGAQVIKPRPIGTATTANVAASATSVSLLASSTSRLGATFFNDSTVNLYLKFGATASTTSFTVKIGAGGYYELPANGTIYTGAIDGIWDSATGNCRVTSW